MATRIITCPHKNQPERIEYQLDVLGALIDRCSAFCPSDAVDCPRTCAAVLDRERHGIYEVGDVIEVSTLMRRK